TLPACFLLDGTCADPATLRCTFHQGMSGEKDAMADTPTDRVAEDAGRTAEVAALVARAGLKLKANEIAGLVSAYSKDRAGFERLRAMLSAEDETYHVFRAGPSRGASA